MTDSTLRRKDRHDAITRVRKLPRLPQRSDDANKGDFGRILVIGGSLGMVGAPALVGLSALRSGAGLVTLAIPDCVHIAASVLCPCATTVPLPSTPAGQIDPDPAIQQLRSRGFLASGGRRPDVLISGPGVGSPGADAAYGKAFWALIDAFRADGVGTVLDADALNLAGTPGPRGWDARPHPRTVITPHPGELARMHGVSAREIQADREAYALRTARMMSAGKLDGADMPIVVLKGAGTIVTDGSRVYVNTTGNPGMASGGSGDVLAGMIGALMGQKLSTFGAAVAGVWLHGRAGDVAARRFGQVSLIATDLIDCLPEAFSTAGKRG